MNGACNVKLFWAPPPGAQGRGQKVECHLISITMSISKIFIPNFVCVLTNERYKTYQTGFSFYPQGHALGVGLWGAGGAQGVKKKFLSNMAMWYIKSGRVAQSVTCLATDACLTADPGVASSIPVRSHTFVEIDHEIISTVILLPSADLFKKGCCQLQAKVCA